MTTVISDLKISPENYHEAAVLAYEVGEQMIARLDWMALQPKRIIDMGCGTGHHTPLLKKRYPHADCFELDISFPRLAFAKKRFSDFPAHWLCADVEHLPFPNHSIDLIIANLILPWCPAIEATLREWLRVLTPNGLLMLTSLGPDTLQEFKIESIQPQLIDMHHWGDALLHTGFVDPVMDVDYFTLRYKNSTKMANELHTTDMLKEIIPMPEPLSATYEIVFGHAWTKLEVEQENIIKIPVHKITK